MTTKKIEIGAPTKRALNANERQVLEYLKQGMSPADICRKMRICFKSSWMYNVHDVPTLTYQSIICSIREKGWDIPGEQNLNRKENEEMAVMITTEKIEEIQKLRAEGMSIKQIEAKTGISHGTIIKYTKKEPETAATETGSKQEIGVDIPADIIPEAEKNVKPSHNFSPLVADAVWRKINDLREEAIELQDRELAIEALISDYKGELRRIDEQLMYVEAEIDILMSDYEAVTKGGTGSENYSALL